MSVVVHKTDAIIVTDYESMAELVMWANGDMAGGLAGKMVIVVASSWDLTEKKPKPCQQAIVNLFCALVAQSQKFGLDFVFILNSPERLDPRLKRCVEGMKSWKA